MSDKPIAPSCERNQQDILNILQKVVIATDQNLLEIGSGTGQHAVFMSAALPNLQWHTADLIENHAGIRMWLAEAAQMNLHGPHVYKAGATPWVNVNADIIFTANTLHIMAWDQVVALIAQLGEALKSGARVVIYGPFSYGGQFTSESNAKFEQWLKSEGEHRGIRDFEAIEKEMLQAGLSLASDFAMPSNNRILVFSKK